MSETGLDVIGVNSLIQIELGKYPIYIYLIDKTGIDATTTVLHLYNNMKTNYIKFDDNYDMEYIAAEKTMRITMELQPIYDLALSNNLPESVKVDFTTNSASKYDLYNAVGVLIQSNIRPGSIVQVPVGLYTFEVRSYDDAGNFVVSNQASGESMPALFDFELETIPDAGFIDIIPVGHTYIYDISDPANVKEVDSSKKLLPSIPGVGKFRFVSSTLTKLGFGPRDGIRRVVFTKASSMTLANRMFSGVKSLEEVIVVDKNEFRNVTDMFRFLYQCHKVKTFPELNLESCVDARSIAQECSSLVSFNTTNMPKVTSYKESWQGCKKLKNFPTLDMSKITDMFSAFDGCNSFTDDDINRNKSYPVCTDFSFTWRGTYYTHELGPFDLPAAKLLIGSFQSSGVKILHPFTRLGTITNMKYLFSSCSALTDIPAIDSSECLSFQNMFYRTPALRNLHPLDLGKATTIKDMFKESGVTTWPATMFNSLPNLTDASGCFVESKALVLPPIDMSNVTNLENLYAACRVMTAVPTMDTKNATNIRLILSSCAELIVVPDIDASSAVNIGQIFQYNKKIKHANILHTNNAENAYGVFYRCEKLISVGEMSMPKVTKLDMFFKECSSLTSSIEIDAPVCKSMKDFMASCTSLVKAKKVLAPQSLIWTNAFKGCSKLTCIGGIDSSATTNSTGMFTGCGALTEPNTVKQGQIMSGTNWTHTCP